jgi:TP901-1 family phage major tail protein
MAPQKGKDLLLKLDVEGSGSFTTVAGLRTHTLALNAQSIDATHQQSAGQWRELLLGGGMRSANVRGSGLFRDETSDDMLRRLFFEDAVAHWQIIIPGFGVIEGRFQIVALEYGGRHDGEMTFDLALDSAGELAFSPL